MATAKNKQPTEITFWRAILQRRVLQIIGIYIAVGWGIIQFVDWIVNRYVLSPHLIDLALIILLSLLPSMLIIAFFHGRPGRDRWTRVEKITIPVNLLVTAAILIVFSSSRDLGAAQKAVTFKNESGVQVQKLIPKNQFRKKVALFYFLNQSGDKSLDWLQHALTHLIEYDLSQDLFLEISSLYDPKTHGIDYYYFSKTKEAGYQQGLDLPLGFEKKLAEEMHKNHFLHGTINKNQDKFVVNTSLYKTQNGRLVKSRTLENTNIFQLVDQLTVQLKEDLDIPAGHIKEVNDLPIAEIFTKSMKASRLFTLGKNAIVFKNSWSEAEKYMSKALEEDATFAVARTNLTFIYLMTNQLSKWMESYGPLMKHLHKLPERHQLFAKVGYYQSKQDVVKTISVLKMIIQMYPQDLEAQSTLAGLYSLYQQPGKAITVYQRMLEIDPTRYEVYKSMGQQYQAKGDNQRAKTYLQKYAEKFPKSAESFTLIGDLNRSMGNYGQSKEFYEKALLLEPEGLAIQLKFARNELNLGHFEAALNLYHELLQTSESAKQKVKVYEGLIGYFRWTGQMNKALEYTRLKLKTMSQYTAPVIMLNFHLNSIDDYLRAGKEKEAWQVLAELKKTIPPPLDKVTMVGDLSILLEQTDADKIEKLLPQVESLGKALGKENLEPLLCFTRGKVAELRQQYDQAIHHYKQQLKLKPTSTTAKRLVARCYQQQKQYTEAETLLKEINKLQPFEPEINLDLAELYWQMGKKDLARGHLKTALTVWQDADASYDPAQKAKKLMTEWQL